MKVYDIISEATPQYTPGALARRNAARAQAPAASTQTAAPSPAATPAKTSGPSDLRKQRTAQAAELRRQGGPKSARKLGDIVKKHHEIWKTGNTAAAQAMEKSFWAKLGTSTGTLFKLLGLGASIADLYIDLAGLEDLYNNKELTKEEYEAEREFAFGVFEAQIIVPMIVRFVANSRIVIMLVRLIKNVVLGAGAVAGVATGGVVSAASIAAMVATEAGITAFQMWLGSDQGKDVLAKSVFMPIIKGGGYVGEGLWNKLLYAFSNSSFYPDAEKKQGQFQNKKALDTAKTPQEKQAAQQAIDTAKATQDRSDDIDALQDKLK